MKSWVDTRISDAMDKVSPIHANSTFLFLTVVWSEERGAKWDELGFFWGSACTELAPPDC